MNRQRGFIDGRALSQAFWGSVILAFLVGVGLASFVSWLWQ